MTTLAVPSPLPLTINDYGCFAKAINCSSCGGVPVSSKENMRVSTKRKSDPSFLESVASFLKETGKFVNEFLDDGGYDEDSPQLPTVQASTVPRKLLGKLQTTKGALGAPLGTKVGIMNREVPSKESNTSPFARDDFETHESSSARAVDPCLPSRLPSTSIHIISSNLKDEIPYNEVNERNTFDYSWIDSYVNNPGDDVTRPATTEEDRADLPEALVDRQYNSAPTVEGYNEMTIGRLAHKFDGIGLSEIVDSKMPGVFSNSPDIKVRIPPEEDVNGDSCVRARLRGSQNKQQVNQEVAPECGVFTECPSKKGLPPLTIRMSCSGRKALTLSSDAEKKQERQNEEDLKRKPSRTKEQNGSVTLFGPLRKRSTREDSVERGRRRPRNYEAKKKMPTMVALFGKIKTNEVSAQRPVSLSLLPRQPTTLQARRMVDPDVRERTESERNEHIDFGRHTSPFRSADQSTVRSNSRPNSVERITISLEETQTDTDLTDEIYDYEENATKWDNQPDDLGVFYKKAKDETWPGLDGIDTA